VTARLRLFQVERGGLGLERFGFGEGPSRLEADAAKLVPQGRASSPATFCALRSPRRSLTMYQEDFEGEVTEDRAREIGTRLVNLIMLLRQKPPARSPEIGADNQGAQRASVPARHLHGKRFERPLL